MYCAGCGTELEAGLKYCKRCGNRVAGEEPSKVGMNLSNALGAIGVFGLLGFGGIMFLMMRSPIIEPGTIMMVSFLYLATLFGICYLILRQTETFTTKRTRPENPQTSEPLYIKPATTARLGESTFEPISVTEETTRDLENMSAAGKTN